MLNSISLHMSWLFKVPLKYVPASSELERGGRCHRIKSWTKKLHQIIILRSHVTHTHTHTHTNTHISCTRAHTYAYIHAGQVLFFLTAMKDRYIHYLFFVCDSLWSRSRHANLLCKNMDYKGSDWHFHDILVCVRKALMTEGLCSLKQHMVKVKATISLGNV